ncbi:MAG TPA: hypothetical protein VIQ02_20055 [Jiangellaceae bacterium]
MQQSCADEVPLVQRAGESRVDARHHALPPLAPTEGVAYRVHGDTCGEHLAAGNQTVLCPGQYEQLDGHLHALSLLCITAR